MTPLCKIDYPFEDIAVVSSLMKNTRITSTWCEKTIYIYVLSGYLAWWKIHFVGFVKKGWISRSPTAWWKVISCQPRTRNYTTSECIRNVWRGAQKPIPGVSLRLQTTTSRHFGASSSYQSSVNEWRKVETET